MFLAKVTPSKFLIFSLVILVVLASLQLIQAKVSGARSLVYSNLRNNDAIKTRRGGCAAFGHSCFGGHGKRADDPADGEDTAEGLRQQGDDLGASGLQERSDQGELALIFPEDYLKFSNFLKKWLASSYRRDLVVLNE